MADHTRPLPLQPPVLGTMPATATTRPRPSGLPAPSFLGHPTTLPGIKEMHSPKPQSAYLPPIQLPPLGQIEQPRPVAGSTYSIPSHFLTLDAIISRDTSPMPTRLDQPQTQTRDHRFNIPATTNTQFTQPYGQPQQLRSSTYETRQYSGANVVQRQLEPEYNRGYPPRDGYHFSPVGVSQSSSPSTRYYEEATSPRTPMPPPASTAPNLNYKLIIRQQPAAARACGFGERDRRVIDPPPILELRITDPETGAPKEDHPAMLALSCTLMTPDGKRDDTEVPGSEPNTQATRRLMGTLVASPYQAKDEHGVAGTFFVFPDLSCRSPGRYRLRWKLIRIDPTNMFPGQSSPAVANIMSDVFAVFTAKDFPGMRASSALLKALRRQGLNVGVKKGSEARKGKGKTKKEESDSEDDDSEQSDVEAGASTTSRSTGGVSPKSKPSKKNIPKRKRRDS